MVFNGRSMMRSLPLERLYRDSRCGSLMLPFTAEICQERLGHEVPLLWRWVHQIHHSPARLHIFNATRFHPFEQAVEGDCFDPRAFRKPLRRPAGRGA